MGRREGLKRCGVLAVGLFIMALGVALSVKANLGTSPISCVPYVYCLGLPFTMGEITIVMHLVFVLLQVVLLRREFQPVQLLQLPIALVFGGLTDLTLHLVCASVHSTRYLDQGLLCLASCALVSFGVYLEVKARVVYLAGEGLSVAIAKVFQLDFGKVKVGFDVSLVSIGLASSGLLLHHLRGIREGTLAAALLVGSLVRLYNRRLTFVDAFLDADCGTD